jgi:general secretion pathway protein C
MMVDFRAAQTADCESVKRMNHNHPMLARLTAFVVWALVAGSVVFWGLRLFVRAPSAPAHSVALPGAAAAQGDLTRLLGAAPVVPTTVAVAPEAASRFRLHGVMAPKVKAAAQAPGQGVALISVDGKPPRAFAIGARVERDVVLQSVSLRTASIGPPEGGSSLKLELPPLPLPASGRLPAPPMSTSGVPLAAPPALQGAPVPSAPHTVAPRRDQANSR